jgi:hypothetical protein
LFVEIERPPKINCCDVRHSPDLLNHLLLALRLEATEGVPKQGSVKRALKRNFDPTERHHTNLQLELAALALWQGWVAAFEQKLTGAQPPLDVVLQRGSHVVPIEAKVAIVGHHNTGTLAESRQFDIDLVIDLLVRFDVHQSGTFPAMLSATGLRALRAELDPVAALVSRDHQARDLEWHGARLTITSGRTTTPGALTMPIPLDDEARCGGEATQATKSGARWLRLDAVGGYARFSSWWDKGSLSRS